MTSTLKRFRVTLEYAAGIQEPGPEAIAKARDHYQDSADADEMVRAGKLLLQGLPHHPAILDALLKQYVLILLADLENKTLQALSPEFAIDDRAQAEDLALRLGFDASASKDAHSNDLFWEAFTGQLETVAIEEI